KGSIKRLIISLPPRYLKSVCASVAFPSWVLGQDPARRVICVSYSEGLSRKHALDCRALMQSGWYHRVFPATALDPRRNTEQEMMTTRCGFPFTTSLGGTLTGRGGDLIIID